MTDFDARLTRPAGIRSLRLGDTKVTYVPDGLVQLSPRGWLPATTDEVWAAHPEYLDADGYLVGGVGGLLVEHGDRALLIDAGFGPVAVPAVPGRPIGRIEGGTLFDHLTALGRPPATLEAVAITHLHGDHVGWSPRLAAAGVTHLVAEPEWKQRHLAAEHGVPAEALTAMASDLRTVTDGEEIFPGVRAHFTPGHTVGHAAYVITGGGRRLVAFGDAMHSPLQVAHPDWSAVVDHDPAQSAVFRRDLVTQLSEPDTLGFGIHFADVPFGRARRTADGGVAWEAVDE
ncbi:MBL fold metallo-hydrolase [Streptomyces huiliensis]|uniref:MBL fold metallo-hydrolase n=1 Tax=Streptomyces huiliensis TaxID=2876027 RepID=UPI001CBB6E1C|nr:MBL fold metallo-hydrolase [Streptomyces huiliensis]MBZ4320243.1 MBL fold metallo-hydrolase [Streptomyces huiliensis]